jgi:anaerobic magnesium-protoporphyrin IX monomethyl ester cyclase
MINKRILFINPCLRPGARRRYLPVGLASILTAVQKAGIEFDLLDMDAHDLSPDDLRARLEKDKYDIFAFGCIVTAFRLVKELASIIRDSNPDAIIIAGNSVVTSIPELLLRSTEVDIGVMSEGDVTIVELLRALLGGRPFDTIDGIVYLDGDRVVRTAARRLIPDLDQIGFPNWDLFERDRYHENAIKYTVDDSEHSVPYPLNGARGCPYQCTFCYHVFKGQRYRKYSEAAVFAEFERLHDKYGATFIHFWDELSFPNAKSVERLVAQLEELLFRIGWEAVTRGDLFRKQDVPLVKRMRDAGCKSVAFSIENASPEILRAMHKKIELARIVEHSNALAEGGITAFTSIIFGYPQETLETIKATLDLCEQCNIFPSVGFLQPLPGTPIYDWAVQTGLIPDELTYLLQAGDRQDFHVNLTKIPTAEFVDAVVTGLNDLAHKMGLAFENPLKTAVYQAPRRRSADSAAPEPV